MTTMPVRLDAAPLTVSTRRAVRRYSRAVEGRAVVAGDLVAAGVTIAVSRDLAVLLAVAVAAVYWRSQGLYGRRFSLSMLDDLGALAIGGVWAVMAQVLTGQELGQAVWPVAMFLALAAVARVVSYRLVLRWRAAGRVRHPAVVIGAGLNAVSLSRRIVEHPHSGLDPIGFMDDVTPEGTLPLPLLGKPDQLARIVGEYDVSDVIIAFGRMPSAELVTVLRTCHLLDVQIHVVPRLFEMSQLTPGTDSIWGLPLVPLRQPITHTWSRRAKRLIDVVLSGLLLVVLAPVMAVVAALVRWDLGKGVIFRQVRVGLDGRPFTVRKFRSMKNLPEGVVSPWSVDDDQRFGRVGLFLRRFSLDEVPQLFNVFLGDMSMVGPRPERPEFADQFAVEFPRYGDRHRVKVGLTGLAAVEGLRGDTSIEDRAYFDNLYIENWSLWLDVKILVRTFVAVLKGTGG
ncbi:MAG: sugar transferase [Actinomycetota bacterium]|nr:sugar transferase [Actinomycetota bacterium]